MRQFAEEEIVIPDGPFKGRRFRGDRQPYTSLLYDQIDSGRWQRIVVAGPTQSGKTLSGYVVPMLYHLFEVGETVIGGLPSMDMAGDKWEQDILPAIEASRYRDLIPVRGQGSRGGKVSSITFLNGATLRFMSGGGSDKKRAGFTSRVVVITETDGMDESGEASREADKITQLEARTRAFGSQARIYMECTVSIEKGRTWQEYTHGSESRIVVKCGHCGVWGTPEREHLVGWQDAESKIGARASARFLCPNPDCAVLWTEEERRSLNSTARVLHKGQEVTPEGEIVGALPETDTLGFRWNAFNNLFVTGGDIGADEWRASHAANSDNAEKELRQFVWTLPVEPEVVESAPLEIDLICRRTAKTGQGIVPKGTERVTVGIDLGKYVGHYVVLAWRADASCVVIDYGTFDIPSHNLPTEKAIPAALREFSERCDSGWDGHNPAEVWIDSSFEFPAVCAFVRSAGETFRPVKGWAAAGFQSGRYHRPPKLTTEIRHIGEQYHITRQRKEKVSVVHVDVDYWKTRVHERLTVATGEAGALTLFDAPPQKHLTYARHLTAEKQVEEWVPGKGTVIRWEQVRKGNHFLDATELGIVAGQHLGSRILVPTEASPARGTETWFAKQKRRPK